MARAVTNKYGNKIFLLGTAEYGPVNTPLEITSMSYAKKIFGNKGTLLDAFRVIRENDSDCEVFFVKVTGCHSELYLDINCAGGEIEKNAFYIKSKYANEIFDDIEVVIRDDALYINYPTEQLGDYYIEYKYNKTDENDEDILDSNGNKIYKTVYDIVEEINEDTRLLNSNVYCYATCEPNVLANSAFVGVNETYNKLNGGNSGLYYNKNMMYICLEETYNILEGRDIDIIIPVQCYYDDLFTDIEEDISVFYDLDREYLTLKDVNEEYVSYYQQLLEFCRRQLRFGFITHGVMGMNPTNDIFLDEDNYYLKLEYFRNKEYNNLTNSNYRHLVSVCVGDIYTTYGTRVYNSYIMYACLIAQIQIRGNTTNQPIAKSFTMYNDFTSRMLSKIKDLGYTTFRYSMLKKAIVCANGVTTSNDDNFKYLTNVRMCQLTMIRVNKLLSEYIGENINTLVQSKEIYKRLLSLLTSLTSTKILKGFSINSITIPQTGHMLIDLSFKTIYMVESIRAYAGLAIYSNGGNGNEQYQ